MHGGRWEIVRVTSGPRLDRVRELTTEYVETLGFPLDFQDFEGEMKELPGDYSATRGFILLAEWQGNVAGCVAVRPLDETTCEMKRLYVRAEFRRHGLGRALAERAVAESRRIGYRSMRLDTMASMAEANALYQALGFIEISAYRDNPRPDAKYFELRR